MKTLEFKVNFQEGILGTCPANEDIYRDFIGSKAPDAQSVEEEVAALGVDGVAEKGMTVFPRNAEGKPFIYDYQIKGFFKDACKMLKSVPGTEASKLGWYKSVIDGLVFVSPREIILDGELTTCQRPLRAETMQGPRVALAMSEEVKNASCEFEVNVLTDKYGKKKKAKGDEDGDGDTGEVDMIKLIREIMDYGRWRGIGQWRNSGKGSFLYEELNCY